MSGAQFTPGPWRIDPRGNCDVQSADGRLEIATTHQDILNGGYRDPVTAQADARLIAASPELYEADEEALDTFAMLRADLAEEDAERHAQRIAVIDLEIERLTAALTKARGDQ